MSPSSVTVCATLPRPSAAVSALSSTSRIRPRSRPPRFFAAPTALNTAQTPSAAPSTYSPASPLWVVWAGTVNWPPTYFSPAHAFGGNLRLTTGDDRARSSGRAVAPLRPETSDNYDAGFRFTRGPVQASVTAFTLSLSEAIVSQTLILPQGAVGRPLGDQIIARQLPSGAVFVPIATAPGQVRASGLRGAGLPPDIEGDLLGSCLVPRALWGGSCSNIDFF